MKLATRFQWTVLFLGAYMFVAGCSPSSKQWTDSEARDAFDATVVSSQALTLATNTVELTTNFTIGQAVGDAAEDLKTFIETNLPCAGVTIEGTTLTVVYGAVSKLCFYNGQLISGTHKVTVSSATEGELLVEHEWIALSNAVVEVSGTASVTWSAANSSRNIVHELTWTRLFDGESWTGGGDRTQTALDDNILVGIVIDGSRYWETPGGTWELDINQVEARWIDAVPQSGSYILESPDDKTLTLSFERTGDATIQVTLAGPENEWSFDVTQDGAVSE